MIDNPNIVERIFYGNSKPITYFFAGFIGSPIVALLVIKVFSLTGAYAEKSDGFIPSTITMAVGTLICVCIGWSYAALIGIGIWRYHRKESNWIRHVLIGLMAIHVILTLFLTFIFIDFSIFSTQILQDGGPFLLNVT